MNSILEAIEELKNGRPIILVDDEERENEGDLVIAAEHITPEIVNFMSREARGLICLSVTTEQVQKLNLPLMVRDEVNMSQQLGKRHLLKRCRPLRCLQK